MLQLQGLVGVALLIVIGVALSSHRSKIDWRIVIAGVVLQVVLAFAVLKFGPVVALFDGIAAAVTRVISFADAGIAFLFGSVANPGGPWGFVFVVRVLPVIIFFAALMSVLYHLGVMQVVVASVAWVLRRSLGITGAEALSASANIFVGQTEAPLTVRPYIAGMTRSQIMCIMVGGFATIAGSVMAAYIGMLGGAYAKIMGVPIEQGSELFAKHLLTASLMSAPAGIVFAKIMVPETEVPRPESVDALMSDEKPARNLVDAAALGATDGLKLALNVAAMLVAFVALLAMIDWCIGAICGLKAIAPVFAAMGIENPTLASIMGWALSPVAWAMGVPWSEAQQVGGLLGTQVIATEFVAYTKLTAAMETGALSPRSAQIVTYALCGFANVASIGIQIGGLSALAPERRSDLAALAPRAMVAGALACWMTGAVASVFI
jgi:concentrative nucleoside transporter, CNT family